MSNLDQELRYAAARTDLDRVRELIEQGADLEAADEYGRTPLQIAVDSADQTNAVGYGTPEMVVLLLDLGADPNTREVDGHSPIFRAVQQASTTEDVMSRALLDAGADTGIENNRGNTVISNYERSPSYPKAGLLDQSVRASREPMHLAAEHGDDDRLQELIESGEDVNQTDEAGYSVLAGAVSADKPETVRLLLEAGADPNLLQGPSRIPLLNMSIARRYDEVIKELVAGGADPDLKGDVGFTPREFAEKVSQPYFD